MNNSAIESPKVDEIFHWKKGEGIPGAVGCCRIRIYCNSDDIKNSVRWVIIGSEIRQNEGQSITNCVEFLVKKVCDSYGINSGATAWIEHYDKESYGDIDREEDYSLVTLSIGKEPKWKHMRVEEVESLILEVETIGKSNDSAT